MTELAASSWITPDVRALLRKDPWFGSLPAELELALLQLATPRRLRSGEALFLRGSPPDGLYAAFREVRKRCEREPHLLKEGSAFVFYALMDQIVDRYFPILETLGSELEELEDRIFTKASPSSSRAIIEDLYSLKRRLVMLYQHTAPLLEPLAKLTGGRIPQVCSGMEHYFRDVYDHLQRIVKTIEGRREMVVTAIQVNLGMISLAENEVTKRLEQGFRWLMPNPTRSNQAVEIGQKWLAEQSGGASA